MAKKIAGTLAAFSACAAFSAGAAQDMPASYTCVKNADTTAFSQTLPQLYGSFQLMASLPVSGRYLHATLTDPANDLRTCLSPPETNNGGFSTKHKAAVISQRRTASATPLHESFHAGQYARGAMGYVAGGYTLMLHDNIATDLLLEATAAAYPFITAKEAEQMGLEHPDPAIPLTDAPRVRALFDDAYRGALDATGAMDKALEAGGKAVVRALLEGRESRWINFYLAQAFDNTRRYPAAHHGGGVEYLSKRLEIFSNAGRVSERISITPDELLGQEADAYIKRTLEKQRYKVPAISPPRKTPAGIC
jgi:hypothetical protein